MEKDEKYLQMMIQRKMPRKLNEKTFCNTTSASLSWVEKMDGYIETKNTRVIFSTLSLLKGVSFCSFIFCYISHNFHSQRTFLSILAKDV